MDLFYLSVPGSHNSVTVSLHNTKTPKLKQHIIIHTCAFPHVTRQNVFVKKHKLIKLETSNERVSGLKNSEAGLYNCGELSRLQIILFYMTVTRWTVRMCTRMYLIGQKLSQFQICKMTLHFFVGAPSVSTPPCHQTGCTQWKRCCAAASHSQLFKDQGCI